jgi:hypothetical protein
MRKLSPEDAERKKFIFDSMSPRRQKHILKRIHSLSQKTRLICGRTNPNEQL